MKKLHLNVLALMLLISITATSQSISGENERYHLKDFFSSKKDFQSTRYQSEYFLRVKFSKPLSLKEQKGITESGIRFIQTFGKDEYLVALNKEAKQSQLQSFAIESIEIPKANEKLSQEILNNDIPSWAERSADRVKVSIIFNKEVSPYQIQTILEEYEAGITKNENYNGFIQLAELNLDQLADLAAHPLVMNIDFLQEPEQKLNFENRSILKVNSVQSNIAGGLNLRGEGVCIGIGDGGELGKHSDFSQRVINKASGTYSSFGSHGDHVSGIVGSAGYINPWHRGVAPAATLITQKTSLVTYYTEDYYNEHGMVLTNNSYGTSSNCTSNGTYNYTSISLDQQLNSLPEVLHVFAAGNSGGATCEGYAKGYHTVLRYYQAAKNVLTVGNLKENRVINPNSSRGPVMDGRLKPEIVGVGTAVISTGNNFNYYSNTGTSMASPSVTGILGLMYERYRTLHQGANPAGALMKAIVCNTAEDLGNPGPDFIHGFGLANARRAINAIDNSNHMKGSVANGGSNSSTITVPANTSMLKVMLYWSDPEGASGAPIALVNDLDISIDGPSGSFLPWVLNTTPTNVQDPATRGVDRLNNIEQITIDNPAAGDYTINVKGFNIPLGAQQYWVTYEFVKDDTQLTYPIGGEVFEPGKKLIIEWEAPKSNSSNFKIEWSQDNGSTWQEIASSVASTKRYYVWYAPAVYTESAMVRVTRLNDGQVSVSESAFRIIGTPGPIAVSSGCAHTLDITWNKVPEIAAYKVLKLTESGYVEIAEVTGSSYNASGEYFPGEEYWFAIQGVTATGKKGMRTIAKKGQVISGLVCNWPNDGVVFLPVQELARAHTVDSLSSSHPIKIKVFNAGMNDLNKFTLKYSINQGPQVSEIFNTFLASGDSIEVTFNETADLSAAGEYFIETWMEIEGDTHLSNDYLPPVSYAKQLSNDPVPFPHNEKMDNDLVSTTGEVFAVEGLEHMDIFTGTLAEVSMVKDGNRKVLSLKPLTVWQEDLTFSKARFTYNLETFKHSNDQVLLSFDIKGHSQINAPGWDSNGAFVQVRGTDKDDWIDIYEFNFTEDWTRVSELDISAALSSMNQSFGSSFQLQFVQDDLFGISIDDVVITSAALLPVDWTDFDIQGNENGDVLVSWSTASEFENNQFEIQVARENNSQELIFKTIGIVQGNGTSANLNEYHFVDDTPYKTGIRYYRIKQVDLDGTTTYTEIRQLRFSESVIPISVYPNPVIDDLFIHYEAQKDEQVTLHLVDLTGRVLLTKSMDFEIGNHDFNFDLEFANIPAGFYALQFMTKGKRPRSIRIQKIRD